MITFELERTPVHLLITRARKSNYLRKAAWTGTRREIGFHTGRVSHLKPSNSLAHLRIPFGLEYRSAESKGLELHFKWRTQNSALSLVLEKSAFRLSVVKQKPK